MGWAPVAPSRTFFYPGHSMPKRMMKLGAVIGGGGINEWAWRRPGYDPTSGANPNYWIEYARNIEKAKFDFLFVSDTPYIDHSSPPHFLNRLEPLTGISAVAAATTNLGLVATVSTSFADPFTVARQLASIDRISHGRVGWNIVTTGLSGAAANFSQTSHLPPEDRYRRAAEHVKVVKGLWHSWEEDAFLHDKETGVFFDPEKLHRLDHAGEFFSVRGPLNVARSDQGHPVLFQAGSSEPGRAFAAQFGEVLFADHDSFEQHRAYYVDMQSRMAAMGRDPENIVVVTSTSPIIGSTDEEAEAIYAGILAETGLHYALARLSHLFDGYDFAQHDPDAMFPDLPDVGRDSYRSETDNIKSWAKRDGLTLREVAQRRANPRPKFFGSAERVADEMERWFVERAVDGYIMNLGICDSLDAFIEQVLPILQKKGVFRTEYDTTTFRGNLGLQIPHNIRS
jgi:FMN-dependent oxidoreductase (nitrilotriacetate monooxygenase family)